MFSFSLRNYSIFANFHFFIPPFLNQIKLCRVRRIQVGQKSIPYIVTHDGRTIRYPHPDVRVHDTVKIDLATGKIIDFIKFEVGNLCMLTGGHNLGRVGIITRREKHPGSFEIIHLKDSAGHLFSTRINNVFLVGKGTKSLVSLPRDKGVRKTIIEEQAIRMKLEKKKSKIAAKK